MALENQSLEALEIKAALLSRIIHEAKAEGDERWKDRVEDLYKLQDAIKERKPAPPPIVIGMKPADMNSRAPGFGRSQNG